MARSRGEMSRLLSVKLTQWRELESNADNGSMRLRVRTDELNGEGIFCNEFQYGRTRLQQMKVCDKMIAPNYSIFSYKNEKYLDLGDYVVENFRDSLHSDGPAMAVINLEEEGLVVNPLFMCLENTAEALEGASSYAFEEADFSMAMGGFAKGLGKFYEAYQEFKMSRIFEGARKPVCARKHSEDTVLSSSDSADLVNGKLKRVNMSDRGWPNFSMVARIGETNTSIRVSRRDDVAYTVNYRLSDTLTEASGPDRVHYLTGTGVRRFLRCIYSFMRNPKIGVCELSTGSFFAWSENYAHTYSIEESVQLLKEGKIVKAYNVSDENWRNVNFL